MLKLYFVMHSTVTNFIFCRLTSITKQLAIKFKPQYYENFKQQSINRNIKRNKK